MDITKRSDLSVLVLSTDKFSIVLCHSGQENVEKKARLPPSLPPWECPSNVPLICSGVKYGETELTSNGSSASHMTGPWTYCVLQ